MSIRASQRDGAVVDRRRSLHESALELADATNVIDHGAHAVVDRRARSHASDDYDQMMCCPRFVVSSAEELEDLARAADPPVQLGQRAELVLNDRRVLLEVDPITPLVEWIEVRP